MKKITLTINGKEQTFRQGSVVEVAMFNLYAPGMKTPEHTMEWDFNAVGYVEGKKTKGNVEMLVISRVDNDISGDILSRVKPDEIPTHQIKSVKELGEYTAKDIEKAYDKGVSDCDRDGNPPEQADRIISIKELK